MSSIIRDEGEDKADHPEVVPGNDCSFNHESDSGDGDGDKEYTGDEALLRRRFELFSIELKTFALGPRGSSQREP